MSAGKCPRQQEKLTAAYSCLAPDVVGVGLKERSSFDMNAFPIHSALLPMGQFFHPSVHLQATVQQAFTPLHLSGQGGRVRDPDDTVGSTTARLLRWAATPHWMVERR